MNTKNARMTYPQFLWKIDSRKLDQIDSVHFSKGSLKDMDYASLLFKVISIRVSNSAVATQIHVSAAP